MHFKTQSEWFSEFSNGRLDVNSKLENTLTFLRNDLFPDLHQCISKIQPHCTAFLQFSMQSNFEVGGEHPNYPCVDPGTINLDIPDEQLSKLRSPRMTSKATRSSSTFSPSSGMDDDWRNSAPHWSNRSSCSHRTDASPEIMQWNE